MTDINSEGRSKIFADMTAELVKRGAIKPKGTVTQSKPKYCIKRSAIVEYRRKHGVEYQLRDSEFLIEDL